MAIQIKLDEEHQNIVWQVFPEEWEWEEYLSSTTEVSEMIRKNDFITHLIIDLQNTKIPRSGTAFQYSRKGAKLYPDNIGKIVLITKIMLISTLVNSIRRVIRAHIMASVHTAETVEQAYQFLLDQTD